MFREMQRKKQALDASACVELLKNETRGVLSVIGDDGYPYGMPMNHYYHEEDGCLYFHCGKRGHRIDALSRSQKASFCVFDKGVREEQGWALTVCSVIVFGDVEIVTDPEVVSDISRKLSHKFTSDEAYIDEEIRKYAASTVLLRLKPLHMCGKRVQEK